MIVASTLIVLAEAASTCPGVGGARLGGGAILVRPVGTFEPLPFKRLGPAIGLTAKPEHVQQTKAETPEAEGSQPQIGVPENCEAPISIA